VASKPLSKRESAAWRGFLRAHSLLWRELEEHLETRHAISLSAYDVLVLLDEAPGSRLRMSELAGAVLMSSGGFTRLADRLCAAGLAARERATSDHRGFELLLTPAGRERLEQARKTHRADIRERFLSRLDSGEQELLASVWRRIGAEAQDIGSE
jgi:DNA-binding MarR family transcriptional regulator